MPRRTSPTTSSRIFRAIGGPALLCLAVVLPSQSVRGDAEASGRSEIVLSLAPGNQPEGIAVHQTGDVFVGNRQVGDTATLNQILRMEPDGVPAVFATLPGSSPDAEGFLGLAVDSIGNVYAAFVSFDANHGVWRVSRDGAPIELLQGSQQITFPNALTFDRRGNLYVTDSAGAIGRARPGRPFEIWVEHELLRPLQEDPLGFPLPGANGIAFYPPDTLFVANTERGLVARVRIKPDGSPGAVEAVTLPFAVPAVDGIVVDVHGQIHAVLPGFALFGASPIVRIDPGTGAVIPTVTDPIDMSRFDTPLSLAFGGGRWGVTTLLVTKQESFRWKWAFPAFRSDDRSVAETGGQPTLPRSGSSGA